MTEQRWELHGCFEKHKPMNQHLIVDVPVKALIVKDDKVLITKDRRWELPGGRMHKGETPTETLRRELQEELGATVIVHAMEGAFVRPDSDPPHLILVYRCELTGKKPFQPDEKEIQEMRWISKDDDLSTIDFFYGYADFLRDVFSKQSF